MDVVVHPRFAENNLIYLTYNKTGEKGVTMALARGRFDGAKLTDVRDLLVTEAWSTNEGHLSSRHCVRPGRHVVHDACRTPRRTPCPGHDHHHMGKVLRIRDDGTAPPDNPFAGRAGHRPEIFTFGHRNPHGIAIHPETGEVWKQGTATKSTS